MATSQAQLESLTGAYQKLQVQLQSLVEARQQLDSQLSENLQVQKEFKGLKEGENQVYKLVGPVLMKVEQDEARTNVDKRIEFIRAEIKRVEDQLKDISTQSEEKRAQIIKIQQQAQAQAQRQTDPAAAAAASA